MALAQQPHQASIRIIEDEHRSLAAVLHGMLYLVRQTREHGAKPDFKVLGAMLYYIDAVPERFHHPKEDKYLFALLRARCAEARPVLDRLQAEHRTGAEKIRSLAHALTRYDEEQPPWRRPYRHHASTVAIGPRVVNLKPCARVSQGRRSPGSRCPGRR